MVDDRVEAVLKSVRASFEPRAPFAEDRELAGDLIAQARPMVRSFIDSFDVDTADAWNDAAEAYSLLNLLGRHLGERAMTPGAAMTGCDLLFMELCGLREPPSRVERGVTFRGVFVEGYVGGIDARTNRTLQQELESRLSIFETASGTVVLILSGPLRAETIERIGEEFGRVLFRRDASRAIVEFGALAKESLSSEMLDAITSIDAQARTLGCRCKFVGVGQERAAEILGRNANVEMIEFEESLDGLLDDVAIEQGNGKLRTTLRRLDRWLADRGQR